MYGFQPEAQGDSSSAVRQNLPRIMSPEQKEEHARLRSAVRGAVRARGAQARDGAASERAGDASDCFFHQWRKINIILRGIMCLIYNFPEISWQEQRIEERGGVGPVSTSHSKTKCEPQDRQCRSRTRRRRGRAGCACHLSYILYSVHCC